MDVRNYYDEVHYCPEETAARLDRKLTVSDPWYQLIMEFLHRHKVAVDDRRVLEVGCGLGGFCHALAGQGATVTGMDFSVAALRAANRLSERATPTQPLSAPRFLAGNARALPFQDRSFDLIVCAETLEHTFAVTPCLRELWRVCNDGGLVAITIPNSILGFPMDFVAKRLHLGQPEQLLNFFQVRTLAREVGFHPVDEFGTNFFREMVMEDLLPAWWVAFWAKVSGVTGRWIHREMYVWRLLAGTVGLLLLKDDWR
jgi:ubiquinone/menaquinone biosynthesis C-methylase UbiE